MQKKIGYYSFVIGAILAVILGLATTSLGAAKAWLVALLVILGFIVGFLNVTGKETKDYMLAALVIVLVANFGGLAVLGNVNLIGDYLKGIFESLLAFIVPALIVVSLREVLMLSKA